LRSEASQRFEKEVDPARVLPALDRAAALMCRYAGGRAADGVVEASTGAVAPVTVAITLERINGYLGTSLTAEQVEGIFQRLHFTCEADGAGGFTVHVPSRRGDITREVDLIEEVARLHGYDNIPTSLMSGVTTPGSLTRDQSLRRMVRRFMAGCGLHEAITYSFTHPSQIADFRGMYDEAKPVALAMPMSEERSALRTSLIPHLLDVVSYNRNRNIEDAAIFEIGKVFISREERLTALPVEKWLLSGVMTGKKHTAHWRQKAEQVDFYDLKGVVEQLAAYLGVQGLRFEAAQPEGFHPGRTAEISIVSAGGGKERLGWIGQLHPELQRQKDLDDTYVLEIELETVIRLADFHIAFETLPRFPSISRDMALVLDQDVAVGDLVAEAKKAAGELLASIQVFDIYTGERLGTGKKSAAFSLVYRNPERTLTDEEAAETHSRVVSALEQNFGAELRK
jgi:phenylalanyl-tRNA synthetase beta chain